MEREAITIRLKEGAKPVYVSRPFDVPYHLRVPYEKELRNMMDGGLIEPCGFETTNWSSRSVSVLKSNGGDDGRVVSYLKEVNKNINCPTHPTESSN